MNIFDWYYNWDSWMRIDLGIRSKFAYRGRRRRYCYRHGKGGRP